MMEKMLKAQIGGGSGKCVAGYAYRASDISSISGVVSFSSNYINLGFKPKKIYMSYRYQGSQLWYCQSVYDEDISSSTYKYHETNSSSSGTEYTKNISSAGADDTITGIDDNGFSIGSSLASSAYHIGFAVYG